MAFHINSLERSNGSKIYLRGVEKYKTPVDLVRNTYEQWLIDEVPETFKVKVSNGSVIYDTGTADRLLESAEEIFRRGDWAFRNYSPSDMEGILREVEPRENVTYFSEKNSYSKNRGIK